MTTQEVADRFDQLQKENNMQAIVDELYSEDAVSREPEHALSQGLQNVDGLDAIREKGKMFNSMIEEMHSAYCTEPVVGGNFFSVGMGMEVTMKGMGKITMDEVAVYEVKDGKIIKEQFFF